MTLGRPQRPGQEWKDGPATQEAICLDTGQGEEGASGGERGGGEEERPSGARAKPQVAGKGSQVLAPT